MPYLPIDLDGRRNCQKAATVLAVHPGEVSWALQEVWEHVWREHFSGKANADLLSELVLLGCIGTLGTKPRAAEVLTAFEFLERVGDLYRVRGAAKWLYGLEGKRRGGLASKSNLIPGGPRGSRSAQPSEEVGNEPTPLGSAETPAETPAETQPIGRPSALSPSTQHPTTKETKAPREKRASQPPSEFVALRDALVATYETERGEKYLFDGSKDPDAIKALLPFGVEKACARYRIGLRASGFHATGGIAQLRSKWKDLAALEATGPPRPTTTCKPTDRTKPLVPDTF